MSKHENNMKVQTLPKHFDEINLGRWPLAKQIHPIKRLGNFRKLGKKLLIQISR